MGAPVRSSLLMCKQCGHVRNKTYFKIISSHYGAKLRAHSEITLFQREWHIHLQLL